MDNKININEKKRNFIYHDKYKYKNLYKLNFIFFNCIIIINIILYYNKGFLKEKNFTFFNYKLLSKKINETYKKKDYVNINEIESMIPGGRKWIKNKNNSNEINIGIQLDPNYVLRVMMTLGSIIDSQKNTTKLRFHLAVVLSFKVEDMLKIYSLRAKIRDDIEFNFYNAKRVEIELKNLNTKGPGAIAKLLLPELLPDDIERLLVFDAGDLLVLRDLSMMYNWNMGDYLYLGIPGGRIGKQALLKKKIFQTYINTGSILINVKKVKIEKIYKKCIQNKHKYKSAIGDQDLLNDIAFGKVGYLPMRFGICSPYRNDKDSDKPLLELPYQFYINAYLNNKYPYISKNPTKIIQVGYNPIVIHQWNGKWMSGLGLSIYRRLAQYYIRLSGIWNEMCQKLPGYCLK